MARSPASFSWLLPKARFDELLTLLREAGYAVIGPRREQTAIVYGPIQTEKDLPIGWTDQQIPGQYRLKRREDEAWFGFAVGPYSWKQYLFPPTLRLWRSRQTEAGLEVLPETHDPPKRALLGVRSCELHAMAVQDLAFLNEGSGFRDPYYQLARERLFLIVVECQHPASTCFCTSMGTGPAVEPEDFPLRTNFPKDAMAPARRPLPMASSSDRSPPLVTCDLILTELTDAFVVRVASPAGQAVVDQLALPPASKPQQAQAREGVRTAANAMSRSVDTQGVRDLLHRNQEHSRWDDVATRCLACTNCTMVCPTCFCSSLEETADLTLETAERTRVWDSCFNPEFAGVRDGNFRPSIRGRYRQWLTHKFASWFDQFGVSGCVGCGRCITWCPVGIDVTEELRAIRATDGHHGAAK